MPGRRVNLALLAAMVAAVVTGVVAFAVGTAWNRPVTVVHGVAGLAVVVLSPWKSVVARRGAGRRGLAAAVPGLALAAAVGVAVASGLLHGAGARDLGPVAAMQVHVGAAVVAAVLTAAHVVARPVRPRRADLSRRAVLRAGAVAGAAAVSYAVFEAVAGRDRRFTGSHEVGSGDPGAMPVTQWFDDRVPSPPAGWRLVTPDRTWAPDELDAVGDQLYAVLDCTGGWWSAQRWSGARLDRLLPSAAGARSIVVRSATGYARRFPAAEAGRLLLATRAGGRPLSPGHGAPARIVAPGRRGFWWVKWVVEIEVSDRPWWWQAPFPLT